MDHSGGSRVCLITGGTAGIGRETARRLTERGFTVVIVGRDRGRGEAALAAIRAAVPGARAELVTADLSDQNHVRGLAETVEGRWGRLDVLINNAGSMFGRRTLSRQGIEMTFALNHLSYFLLTMALLPLLDRSAPARIVNVASEAHRGVTLDFDDLQAERRYHGWQAYRRSKLANLLFTHELARRLDWQRITVNALHPGFVATDIGVRNRFVPGIVWRVAKLAAIPVAEGAATPVYLASSPEVAGTHGRYFIKEAPAETSAAAHDRDAAGRLWAESVRLTGLSDGTIPAPVTAAATPAYNS